MRLDFAFFTAIQPFISKKSVHQEKNHTVCRHSGGAIFLFICIKKQIIRLAVIQAEWIFLFFLLKRGIFRWYLHFLKGFSQNFKGFS